MTATSNDQLNQVNLDAVGALVGAIQESPSAAETTWSAEVRWTGAFRSEATVREFAPITSDEPAALGGTDRAPNPVEQLLSSLGNCLAVGYAANASVAGVEIRDLRITLDGDIDLHTFLGLADGHAGFSAIRVAVHLDTDADEATVAELHRKVAATSPVGQTLSTAIPVEITHQWLASGERGYHRVPEVRGLLNGDYVVVVPQQPRNGDMVVVVMRGHGDADEYEATVKRLRRNGDSIHLLSSPPAYPDIVLWSSDEAIIQGVVIGVVRWIGRGH